MKTHRQAAKTEKPYRFINGELHVTNPDAFRGQFFLPSEIPGESGLTRVSHTKHEALSRKEVRPC